MQRVGHNILSEVLSTDFDSVLHTANDLLSHYHDDTLSATKGVDSNRVKHAVSIKGHFQIFSSMANNKDSWG